MVTSRCFETDHFEIGGLSQKQAREASLALRFVSVLPEKQLDLKIDPWCEEEMPAYSELPTPIISTRKQTHQRMLATSSRQDKHKLIKCVFLFFQFFE